MDSVSLARIIYSICLLFFSTACVLPHCQAVELLSQQEMKVFIGAGCDEICGGLDGQTKSACGDDICMVAPKYCNFFHSNCFYKCKGKMNVWHAICDAAEDADCDEVAEVTCANYMTGTAPCISPACADCECDTWQSSYYEEGC